jgi:hypothetical protein
MEVIRGITRKYISILVLAQARETIYTSAMDRVDEAVFLMPPTMATTTHARTLHG